jgi:hypothetical protein
MTFALMSNFRTAQEVHGSYREAQQEAKRLSTSGDVISIWDVDEHGDPVRAVAGFDNLWKDGKPWPDIKETTVGAN